VTEQYEFHRYADIFPLMPEQSKDFFDLVDSLRTNTMLVPILLYDNKILDGRNRYRAHLSDPEHIELKIEEFIGTEEQALQRSLALNNQRRHLDEGQRALAALRLSNMQSNMKTVEGQKWAAQIFNVSFSTVRMAFDIYRAQAGERKILLEMIESDDLAISVAHNIFKNLNPIQWEQAALDGKKAKQWIKQTKRQQNEIKFANGTIKANRELAESDMVYGVIYTDPPWTFETRSDAGKDRSAENHYPTMSLDDIRAMKIPAGNDCALFMWVTVPHLHNGIEILQGWGFEYKSAYFWHKTVKGTGYWSANEIEVLLLGTKGNVPAPLPEQRMDQKITAAQGKHSEKPEVFAEGITKMFPHVAKLDMFARKQSHKGENWFYWGNEVTDDNSDSVLQAKTTNASSNGKKKSRSKRNGNDAPGATKEETGAEESIGP
jgi:N6-adenosine-specific RNA methylase IME4